MGLTRLCGVNNGVQFFVPKIPSCIHCPAGYHCPNASIPPIPCPSGTYSSGGNASCSLCPEAQSCLDPAKAPVNCEDGTYSLEVSKVQCLSIEPCIE